MANISILPVELFSGKEEQSGIAFFAAVRRSKSPPFLCKLRRDKDGATSEVKMNGS